MHRVGFGSFVIVAASLLAMGGTAYPCASVRAGARIDTFTCVGCPDGGGGNLETLIHVVSGTVVLTNQRAAPVLGNLVVEVLAREGSKYVPAGRQVINQFGSQFPPPRTVNTCEGAFAAGPVAGRIVFVDTEGNELTFDQVKNLPLGTVGINFVATFAGPLPGLDPGERARVRIFTTAIGADASGLCSVDASGDGVTDNDVKTLRFQKVVRVPTTAFLIQP